MADTLRAISPVELLAPDATPDADALAARLTPALRRTCLAALAAWPAPVTLALAALGRAMAKDPPLPWQDVAFMIATDQPSDESTHDHFFRVRRSAHRDPLGYLRGLFHALDVLARDLRGAPTALSAEALGELAAGLGAAVATALGAPAPALAHVEAGSTSPRPDYAQWRWLRGHHIFAALTQGLIFAAGALEAAGDDAAAMRAAAELWRALLAASGRALELAGDFPVEIYRDQIRGAMQEPFQPKGFSGILSSDHRFLVMRMRALAPALARLKADEPAAHAALVAALAQVYDSHKHVCGRFVGVDQASLLMAPECSRSAVEQIDRFKQMRLRTLQ